MELLKLLIVILLFKIADHIGINLPWYWWVIAFAFYLIDLHSLAAISKNILTVGENIRTVGNYIFEKEKEQVEKPEKKDEEESLH